jgi:hypothetical protein
MWARLDVTGYLFKDSGTIDLLFDLRRFPGILSIVLPGKLLSADRVKMQRDFSPKPFSIVKNWHDQFSKLAERLHWEGKHAQEDYSRLRIALKQVSKQPVLQPRQGVSTLRQLSIRSQDRHTMFFRIDPPKKAKVGDSWEFSIIQQESRTKTVQGGADYVVRINRPTKM